MSNVDIIEQHYAYGNAGEHESDARLFAHDVLTRMPGQEPMHGVGAFQEFVQAFVTGFPDFHLEMISAVESGDTAVAEGILTGTHTGPLQTGAGEIPPTGQRIEIPFADAFQFTDGKITSHRVYFDQMTLMQQLGLLPVPGGTA